MRKELFYNPYVLFPRLGEWADANRRLRRLRGTVAAPLHRMHIDSLELLDLLRPLDPRVIFDIGANIGTWTLLAKGIYPDAEIHAFEPLQEHTRKFKKSTRSIAGITLHEIALGAKNTTATFHINEYSDTSSVLESAQDAPREWGASKVAELTLDLHSLDRYAADHKMRPPDLIKLDVQGFELEVLKSSITMLAHASAVIAEVSFREFYVGQCRFEEVVAFLFDHKFGVHAFGVQTPLGKPILQTDVLFLKSNC
jgi:FkbM family methyltransferase